MSRFEWVQSFLYLDGEPISFAGRPYLRSVYDAPQRRIVLRCSRQVEKTTFIINALLHAAATLPRVRIAVVFPRHEQARVFARTRLLPTIEQNPALRRVLLGSSRRQTSLMNMQFRNGSMVFIRAAFLNADGARGINGDFLFIDEYQDISAGTLPVLEEMLSHSRHGRIILTGTPKSIDNHLEDAFGRSTANEWRIRCACSQQVLLDEQVLGPVGPICPDCGAALDPQQGVWVPRNPDSNWGAGFTVNHLATPWLNYPHLLERQRSYDPAQFRNECLGLPSVLGDHIVTREEVEACCEARPMADGPGDVPVQARGQLVAGIDWGGGSRSRTVLVIGFMRSDDHFVVVRIERFAAREEPDQIIQQLARRCRSFGVRLIAADGGGNGHVYNNLLINALEAQLAGLYAILYSASDQAPKQYKGRLWNWTIGRSASLGMVFTRIKKRRVLFPQLATSSAFLPEIWCEVAEYDDQQRTIKYIHPETQPDDALHALNYAQTLGRYLLNRQLTGGE